MIAAHLAQCDRTLPELVASLAPALRDVVRLYLLDELPMDDVAARFGIPKNTAKARWRRACEELRARKGWK